MTVLRDSWVSGGLFLLATCALALYGLKTGDAARRVQLRAASDHLMNRSHLMAEDDSTGAGAKGRRNRASGRDQGEEAVLAGLPPALRSQLEILKSTLEEAAVSGEREGVGANTLEIRHEPLRIPFSKDNPGLPNGVMRAALFPVLPTDGARPFLRKAQIFSVSGLSVSFTGQRFDQSDLDVLLGIFEIGRYEEIGHKFSFTAHSLLKLLGKTTGGSDHEWLHSVLTRLTGGVVEIRHNKRRFFGALLLGGKLEEGNGRYTIAINADLAVLFGFGMWSYVEREQRSTLGRNQTAKVFHLYYSSHAAPGKHSYETLAALADLQSKQKANLKRKIIKAHDALADPKCGFLLGYQADKDGVVVEKRNTPSQERHLTAKKAARRRGGARDSGHSNAG